MSSTFCPNSAFSNLDFNIEAYVHVDESNPFRVGLKVKDLFKVEAMDPAFTTALKFIVNGRNHFWPPYTSTTKHSEKDVMVSLCSEIFLPLSSEVIMEKTYKTFLEKTRPVPLRTDHIGMGSTNTWHGTPDARVRGTELIWLKASEDKYLVTEWSDESDGTATEVEGKLVAKEANLMQVIGTCVVSSFTAKSNHPEKLAMPLLRFYTHVRTHSLVPRPSYLADGSCRERPGYAVNCWLG